MKTISLSYLRSRIINTHPRTRKAQLNTLLGLLVKGGGMLISLLLVPLTIDYLSKETYGTWLTISSIVTMLVFLDIGIGNGLRNKFSEAVANQDVMLARTYISTAYAIFSVIQFVFLTIFLLALPYIPLQKIFNTHIDLKQLQFIVLVTVVAMAMKLVLDIISYVLFALQESSRVGLITFLSNALILVGTYGLIHFSSGNLIYIAVLSAFSPIIVLLLSGILLYKNKLSQYKPAFHLINWYYAKSLLSLGYKFFVIQIAVVVLFYSDNLIITHLFGPSEVTPYNVSFRYFNAITTIFTIIIAPYWSAFTEAFVKKDNEWIKKTYNSLQKMWLLFIVAVFMMVILAKPIYAVWVGNRIEVPTTLNMAMGLSVLIICWNNITVSVINGLGKVKLQLICSVMASILNIPLAVYLGRELGLGTTGVILSTCLSLLPATITGTLQARKLINGNAYGIWAA
ncbi:oligosaccharide flippase family protein [Spirosoma pulveris]